MYYGRMEKTKSVTLNGVPVALIKKLKREAKETKSQVTGVWLKLVYAGLESREARQ